MGWWTLRTNYEYYLIFSYRQAFLEHTENKNDGVSRILAQQRALGNPPVYAEPLVDGDIA